ncbi:hypothetical protein UFOVP398_33 [uncultured Caudovirales phage]|uniref:Uncharacterized protein n=1 Tax=uncultured Caudovirales phage TaxID=2100421 RepID=A0A6J5M4R4_9CAUD|nr:hypothetical protein UFOVP398_33 [uncultured Caudovirales phage]
MARRNGIFLTTADGNSLRISEKQAKHFEASPFHVVKYVNGAIKEVRALTKIERIAKSRKLHYKESLPSGRPYAIRHPDGRQIS